jgi:signal transduction histidine kinase
LASLKAYVGTLVDNQGRLSPDEQRRYLDIVGRQTERLDRLISDLLQLSVLESEESRLSTEPFAVSDLVQDVFLRFRLPAEQRGVAFDLVLPDAFPYVQGDISLIERVIENLVENALRHTSAGGRVTVALQADQDRAEVQVTDTGRGIKEHDLPFIFDRQFRGAKTMDAVSVGLGLAIAKRIVELHGSALHVTSTVGEGSTFSFALPRIEPR